MPSYTTHARVVVELEIETGTDAWDGEKEPAYRRAFEEAKERAVNIINNAFLQLTDAQRRSCPVRVLGVGDVTLTVRESKHK